MIILTIAIMMAIMMLPWANSLTSHVLGAIMINDYDGNHDDAISKTFDLNVKDYKDGDSDHRPHL